jgi:tRNA threonylcarbamoyladenosine biosynthesis protein TsaE
VSPPTGDGAPVRLRTRSAQETRALGEALAHGLRPGDVVLLAGDLGAGKTTLAQGIGAGLGVADHVTSPTFTLVRSYPCAPTDESVDDGDRLEVQTTTTTTTTPTTATTVRTFLHADLYRLDRLGEVVDLALAELVEDAAVAVVEWGDVAEPVFGGEAISVRLAEGSQDDERSVTLRVPAWSKARRHELGDLLSAWVTP